MAATIDLQILWRFPVEAVDSEGHPAKKKEPSRVRAIAVARDDVIHIVSMPADGEGDIRSEVAFTLHEGIAHAEAVLSGSQQAMTRPGGMRIVAATAKIMTGLLWEPAAVAALQAFQAERS